MVSLSLLAIRPCALQSAAAAPRPHWWIQNMQNNMISILDQDRGVNVESQILWYL